MASTIENFILRFKTEGADKINNAREGVRGLADDVIAANANLGVLGGTFSRVVGGLGTVGLAAAATGVGLAAMGLATVNLADELQDLADATGLSASAILAFKNSVINSGGDADDYQKIIAKLYQSIQDAASGNEAAQTAFKKLGVVVRDAGGNVRSTDDILNDIIYRLQDGGASAAEMSAAIDLMGKVMARLNPANLDATANAVQDEHVKRLADYRTEIDKLKATLAETAITFFGTLAEQINNATSAYQKFKKETLGLRSEAELNPQGLTRRRPEGFMGWLNSTPEGNMPFGQTRPMTPAELSAFQKQQAAAKAKSDAAKAAREESAKGGDYGAPSQSSLDKAKQEAEQRARALAASRQRITESEIRATANITRMSADELEQFEIDRSERLSLERIRIYGQENLSKSQMDAEYAAKKMEINADVDKRIADYNKRQQEQQAREEQQRLDKLLRAREQAAGVVEDAQAMNQQQRERFTLEQQLIGLNEVDKQYQTELFALNQEQLNQLKAIRAVKDLPETERLQREQEITAEYEKQKGILEEQRQKRMAVQNDPRKGIESVLAQMETSASPFQVAADQTVAVFNRMNQALDTFVQTGKFKFKDFARSIILDLIAIEAKAAATSVLRTIVGSFLGTPAAPAVPGRAIGGPVSMGSPYIVGERGPELFVPRTNGNIVPNGQLGVMGSNSNTVVNYTIQAVDALSFRQMLARDPEFLYNLTEQTRRGIPARRRT